MVIQTSLNALASGNPVEISVGETLRVSCSFKYRVAQDMLISLWACPYQRRLGIRDLIQSCRGETNVTLEATTVLTLKEVVVDCLFIPASEGGIGDGTYGLVAEIEGTDIKEEIDNCLTVSGNPKSAWGAIMDIIPLMMIMMMFSMMTPMMKGFGNE